VQTRGLLYRRHLAPLPCSLNKNTVALICFNEPFLLTPLETMVYCFFHGLANGVEVKKFYCIIMGRLCGPKHQPYKTLGHYYYFLLALFRILW
jgi:hypothetical protein